MTRSPETMQIANRSPVADTPLGYAVTDTLHNDRRMLPTVRLQMLRAGEALIVQCSSKIAESTACRHKQVDRVDDHAIHG